MRVVYWGTYDVDKPRNRIMIKGLRAQGLQVIECHANIWKGVSDKSQITNKLSKVKIAFSLLLCYPYLIYKYLRLPAHDAVVLGYMGQFDILVLWLFARLRGAPIFWDVLISLYDTVVNDRKLFNPKSIVASFLYFLEWLATRAAKQIIMDTRAHAQFFEDLYNLPTHSVHHVYVGAELDVFKAVVQKNEMHPSYNNKFTVFFYGQFIPLHGIDTIVNAASIIEKNQKNIRWVLVGKGQEQEKIDALIKKNNLKSIHRISWIPYEKLINCIADSDVCLGIFGASGKALRVIPNKVYQILASGKPLITADTPAIREILVESPILRLITPGNQDALVSAVLEVRNHLTTFDFGTADSNRRHAIGYVEVGNQFSDIVKNGKRN